MNNNKLLSQAAGALLMFAFCGTLNAQTYSITAIGPLPGDAGASDALDVNNNGVVFGTAFIDGNRQSRCFVYDDGAITLFSAESGHPYLWSGAINDTNTLVGTAMVTATFGTARDSFVTAPQFLPELFPLFPSFFANASSDINNNAPPWAVGQRDTGESMGIGSFQVRNAYLVFVDGNPNPPVELGTLGGLFSRAEALNDSRDVVGGSLTTAGPMHAFLRPFATGQMQDLGTLGGADSSANDINNHGLVVGWSRLADGAMHAFVFENETMSSLGTLGGLRSEALGVNDNNIIVGMSFDAEARPRAFLHNGNYMVDLNTRIGSGSQWILQHANAINDRGDIVGAGRVNGETRAFVLRPNPLGDLNADGVVNVFDLFLLLSRWGDCAGSECLADLDGNSEIDVLDLLALLQNWTA